VLLAPSAQCPVIPNLRPCCHCYSWLEHALPCLSVPLPTRLPHRFVDPVVSPSSVPFPLQKWPKPTHRRPTGFLREWLTSCLPRPYKRCCCHALLAPHPKLPLAHLLHALNSLPLKYHTPPPYELAAQQKSSPRHYFPTMVRFPFTSSPSPAHCGELVRPRAAAQPNSGEPYRPLHGESMVDSWTSTIAMVRGTVTSAHRVFY
jgi:hypothetical protein